MLRPGAGMVSSLAPGMGPITATTEARTKCTGIWCGVSSNRTTTVTTAGATFPTTTIGITITPIATKHTGLPTPTITGRDRRQKAVFPRDFLERLRGFFLACFYLMGLG